jgi:hypothetical protein
MMEPSKIRNSNTSLVALSLHNLFSLLSLSFVVERTSNIGKSRNIVTLSLGLVVSRRTRERRRRRRIEYDRKRKSIKCDDRNNRKPENSRFS